MDLITTNELVEAIVGGLGMYLVMKFMRGHLNFGWEVRAAFVFPLVWIIRKVGMNLFNYYN
jgi:hypothetical protein